MRTLKRNQRPFYYCLYLDDRVPGDTAVVGAAISGITLIGDDTEETNYIYDEYGNETGERILHYSAPVRMEANISHATGYAQTEQFGILDNYDKVIVTEDLDCPITESTVLFVEKEPEFTDAETHEVIESSTLFGSDEINKKTFKVPVPDYVVRRVAKSLNSVSIAIRKVEVS